MSEFDKIRSNRAIHKWRRVETDVPEQNPTRPAGENFYNTRGYEVRFAASLYRARFAQENARNPPLSESDARARADAIIARHGGTGNLHTAGVGQELAGLAKTDPSAAYAINRSLMNRVNADQARQAALSFVAGFSDPELIALARQPDGRLLLERIQEHVLSGSPGETERAASARLINAFNGGYNGPAFQALPNRTFGPTDSSPLPPDVNPNLAGAPHEAAAYILGLENNSMTSDYQYAQTNFFTQVLRDHGGDQAYMQNFLGSLGVDKTADFMNLLATPGYKQHSSDPGRDRQVVADAISSLAANNHFSQRDMERLVGQLANQSTGYNQWVTDNILARTSTSVQTMFFRAATDLVMDQPGLRSRETLMASAAYLLANSATTNQAEQLNRLRANGFLGTFVGLTMRGEATIANIPPLDAIGTTSVSSDRLNFNGLSRLMFNVAYEPYNEFGRVPSDDLRAIGTEMFYAASGQLSDGNLREFYQGRTDFKDALSVQYMENYDQIVAEGLDSDSGQPPANGVVFDSNSRIALQNFFNTTLFTPPIGIEGNILARFVSKKQDDLAAELNDPGKTDAFFQEKYGVNRLGAAEVMGAQAGMILNGLEDALRAIKEDSLRNGQDASAVFAVIVTGLGTAAGLPSAGATVFSAAITEVIKAFGGPALADAIANGDYERAVEELKRSGVSVEDFAQGFVDQIRRSLPGPPDQALVFWGDGFNSVRSGRVRF